MFRNKNGSGVPKTSKRSLIITEIVETEDTYLQQLNVVVDKFLQPVALMRWIDPQTIKDIFSELRSIQNLSQTFLVRLRECVSGNIEDARIGQLFLEHSDFFKVYTFYINNYENALSTLYRTKKSNKAFAAFLEEQEANTAHHDLENYLIAVIQRIPRYNMLLGELLRKTEPSHPDYNELPKALESMQEIGNYVNEAKRKAEAARKTNELESLLSMKHSPGRKYIDDGIVFSRPFKKGTNGSYMIVIFSDCVAVAKYKGLKAEKKVFAKAKVYRYSKLEVTHKDATGFMLSKDVFYCKTVEKKNKLLKILFLTQSPKIDSSETVISRVKKETLPLDSSIKCTAQLKDKVWCGHTSGKISLWSTKTLTLDREFQAHKNSVCALLPIIKHSHMWSTTESGDICVWTTDKHNACRKRLKEHQAEVRAMCVVTDASTQTVWTGDINGWINVWSASDFSLRHGLLVDGKIQCFGVVKYFHLWIGSDVKIFVIDTRTRQQLMVLKNAHCGIVSAILWVNNKVWTSGEKGIKVRHELTGAVEETLASHLEPITCLEEVSKKHMWSGSVDKSIIVWDIKTFKKVQELYGHNETVYSIAHIGNGNMVSGGKEDNVFFWTYGSRNLSRNRHSFYTPSRPTLVSTSNKSDKVDPLLARVKQKKAGSPPRQPSSANSSPAKSKPTFLVDTRRPVTMVDCTRQFLIYFFCYTVDSNSSEKI
mmetsp:Transcript_12689/g.14122  ORF Transcript_12689/g.14122 Transcript_12689/m.14122 type:complete len:708 (+) Transcript_12689:199-2322(+)